MVSLRKLAESFVLFHAFTSICTIIYILFTVINLAKNTEEKSTPFSNKTFFKYLQCCQNSVGLPFFKTQLAKFQATSYPKGHLGHFVS